jgi:hypothetical protein
MVPLWIAAIAGFVLIVAYFIPRTQGWGEVAAIWFDVLAAIAFILGGGNLLKVHLKKTSDRVPGWGYSVLTLLAFLTMLYVGLVKFGAPPAPEGEHHGRACAALPVSSIPDALVTSIEGTLPTRADGEEIHGSVRAQFSAGSGRLTFRGWMSSDQRSQLHEHHDSLEWRCAVDRLFEASQPAGALAGKVFYDSKHYQIECSGRLSDAARDQLLGYGGDAAWQAAVTELHARSQRVTRLVLPAGVEPPPGFDAVGLGPDLTYDPATRTLSVAGPMTPGQRNRLSGAPPLARPLEGARRDELLRELRARGPFSQRHEQVFTRFADGTWRVGQLADALDSAGEPQEEDKSWCELRQEQLQGASEIKATRTVGQTSRLNDAQRAALAAFAADPAMSPAALQGALESAGTFSASQAQALSSFLGAQPTVAQRDRDLAFALMKTPDERGRMLSLSQAQADHLLGGYRQQMAWRQAAGRLFVAAHRVKFPWSGEYRAQGTPFWWLYEYTFKPLQATTFAMLAFYVASAAFRAFRAKNVEAALLLSTAFIILLGRTFAGVFLTAWLPDSLSGLKIDNLTVYIMSVFNTAGNRAIMIGVALGIASTSLKVLLGVDRSYLGSGD